MFWLSMIMAEFWSPIVFFVLVLTLMQTYLGKAAKTCNCSCYNLDVGLENDPVLQEKVNNLTKELEIDTKTTNAHIRTLTSAEDDRPSAQAAGYVGIVILCLVFGSLLVLDFTRLCIKSEENEFDFDDD